MMHLSMIVSTNLFTNNHQMVSTGNQKMYVADSAKKYRLSKYIIFPANLAGQGFFQQGSYIWIDGASIPTLVSPHPFLRSHAAYPHPKVHLQVYKNHNHLIVYQKYNIPSTNNLVIKDSQFVL